MRRPRTSQRLRGRPPTPRSVLMRFALGSAAAIAVAVVGGYFALRSVAIDEAKRETRTKVQEAGQLVEANLGRGLLAGRPAAVGAVDDVVVARVLSSSIVRVKIWSADGRVLYVTLRRSGLLVASSFATTHAPSGSFTVRRLISGAQGTFVAVATRPGERCTAHAAI